MVKKGKALWEQVESGEISPQQAYVMALNHPLRIKLLTILTERPSSPSDLCHELKEPLGTVAYHVRVLRELGQVEIVDEKPVRGAMEHFHRAINRPLFHSPDWDKFDPQVRRAISSYGVDAIFKDVSAALNAGSFDSKTDRHLSRVPLLLDNEGWSEAATLFDATLGAVLEIQARSAGRMAESKEEGIATLAAMACFERAANE